MVFREEGEPKFNLTILSFVTEPELGCSAFPSKPNPNGPDYDPDYWFGCSFSPSEPAFNRSMRADYNANTSLLAIVMSWSYDELSPQKPYMIFMTICGGLAFINLVLARLLGTARSVNQSVRMIVTEL